MTSPISFTVPGTPVGKGRPKFAQRVKEKVIASGRATKK